MKYIRLMKYNRLKSVISPRAMRRYQKDPMKWETLWQATPLNSEE